MTNYNTWDKKAAALDKEVQEEEEQEKHKSDVALGLQEGPQGPATAKAKQQREEMNGHSIRRKSFITEQKAKEVVFSHADLADPVCLTSEEVDERVLRLQNCRNVTYEVSHNVSLVKLFVEHCEGVTIKLGCHVKTSFVEISHSENVELCAVEPVSTVQCDECTKGSIHVIYGEPEDVGTLYHQNSPGLQVSVGGQLPVTIGRQGKEQLYTRQTHSGELRTEVVLRGEKEFPLPLFKDVAAQRAEETSHNTLDQETRARADAKRAEGNEAFRACDFLQAAVFYTEAIDLCADLHLAWANRAQCFLKAGQPEKSLLDATRCTELAPEYAKGWFRKGMALHALERYGAAIPALCQAETLDPKNSQISDAIKMAQLKCRQHGPGDVA